VAKTTVRRTLTPLTTLTWVSSITIDGWTRLNGKTLVYLTT